MNTFSLIIPVFFCFVLVYASIKGVDVFASFEEGVRSGLETLKSILPSLLLIMTGVSVLRASGMTDFITSLFEPVSRLTGFPSEVFPVAVLRPFSGSGALSMLGDVFEKYGADSFEGRLSAVICASTETTFYTVGIYLAGLKGNFGKVVACALCADAFSCAAAYIVTSFI